MKRYIQIPLVILLFSFVFFSFYKINENNYKKYNEIKREMVNHPENLPKKEVAKATAFGFENLKADYYWLKTIQYIGGNAYHSEYKKYLFAILDLITDLNPYFEYPYIVGQLLLPVYEPNYELITEKENLPHVDEAITLGLKGVENFCSPEKIGLVDKEDDLMKLWTDPKYKDACLSYQLPFYLAYVYWFYKNDPTTSAKYYKIASVSRNAPEGAKIMAAIMPGKGGNREKSFFMFLTLANLVQDDDEVCNAFAEELANIGTGIFKTETIALTGRLLQDIEELRKEVIGIEEDDSSLRDTRCSNYVNKAVRELNLAYIDKAEERFFAEMGGHSFTAKELYDSGYLEYLPIDFQQYDDYGVIYKFDENVGNYDYIMGAYGK